MLATCLGLFVLVCAADAQVLVGLRIEGPAAVLENSGAQYAAIAEFNDGNEYEVTLFANWSVVPEDYASINEFAYLSTEDVSDNQFVTVHAAFTWDDVAKDASLDVTIVDVTEDEGGDPWPEYQRTASRTGRTSTVGPKTPRIHWTVLVDSGIDQALQCSPSMDVDGRLYFGVRDKVVCVDTITRAVVWEYMAGDNVWFTPCIWQDRIFFGSTNDTFHCVNKYTGNVIWSVPAPVYPNRGQVLDRDLPDPIVYFPSQSDLLYARRVSDGSELWTVSAGDTPITPPALDGLGRILLGNDAEYVARAHAITDGDTLWVGPSGGNWFGLTPVNGLTAYAASLNGPLYAIDVTTGETIWTFDGVGSNSSAIAIGHDGTIYIAENGGMTRLVAVTPEGEELWTYEETGQVIKPPIVDGDGTIYVCSFGSPDNGHVHAVNPDGTALWVKEMPHYVQASPMLAPDGTLYVVCRDKNLYAFKDPAKGDVSLNDVIDGRDIRFFVRVLFGVDDDEIRYFAADMNSDGVVDADDVPLFVDTLLTVEN